MRSSGFLSSALLLASTCAAWPAGWDSPFDRLKQEIAPLYRRAESSSFNLDFQGVQGNTATTVISSTESSSNSNAQVTGTATGSSSGATTTGTNSVTKSASGTASGKSTAGKSEPTTKTFNQEDPAGGISIITPAATATSYYKIADYVTFAWNYTSLSITPSYIDILASCSANQETYTIALNQSVTASTQAVTWDTGAYQATATVPLLTETYTLIVYDAQKPITAAPMAGYLATSEQFMFGMYLPQAYTPLNEYICATCSAAMTTAEVQTLWFLFGTAGITVLSFSWFAGVAGLW